MRLMIGYGNPLRRDDRLGQYLAEKLGQSWRVIASTQLMPEYAEAISHAERKSFFIDAGIGTKPGEILCKVIDPIPAAVHSPITPHQHLCWQQRVNCMEHHHPPCSFPSPDEF